MYAQYKLTLIIWAIGKCQSLMLWLQTQRFTLIEAELTKLEKK